MPLRFQFVSDLHVEHWLRHMPDTGPIVRSQCDTLVVAGDTFPASQAKYASVIERLCRPFRTTLIVPGNHEYYNKGGKRNIKHAIPMEELEHTMREVCRRVPGCHFLNNDAFDLGGVRFLGTTLWSNVPQELWPVADKILNDYSHIMYRGKDGNAHVVTGEMISAIHDRSRAWLRRGLKRCEEEGTPAVVVTHHAPKLMKGLDDRRMEIADFYYCSDCDDLIRNPPVAAWVHGHTHGSASYMMNDVLIAANARGYPGERNASFDPSRIIEILPGRHGKMYARELSSRA